MNNLYKFEKLPFESEFFSETYRLIGRSGKTGAIDQLLKLYPNCVLGIYGYGNEGTTFYLVFHIIFYRICDGMVNSEDVVFTAFNVIYENGHGKSEKPFTLFLGDETPELYFLDDAVPSVMTEADTYFLQGQRILFNEQLEKVETVQMNVDEFFFENDIKALDFDINAPISPDGLLKIELMATAPQKWSDTPNDIDFQAGRVTN